MKERESKSLLFDGIHWDTALLGEDVLLLSAKQIEVDQIHHAARVIESILGEQLKDLVPAYDSIALFSDLDLDQLRPLLEGYQPHQSEETKTSSPIKIPICYELGTDLDELSRHTGLSVEAVINFHLAGTYRSIFIGYTPGFIYADGLNPKLACPRKANPRMHVPAGAIGIAGQQTGIYSLDSPGGWNIIGRTPVKLFDIEQSPPMAIQVGTTYCFFRITTNEFEQWEK